MWLILSCWLGTYPECCLADKSCFWHQSSTLATCFRIDLWVHAKLPDSPATHVSDAHAWLSLMSNGPGCWGTRPLCSSASFFSFTAAIVLSATVDSLINFEFTVWHFGPKLSFSCALTSMKLVLYSKGQIWLITVLLHLAGTIYHFVFLTCKTLDKPYLELDAQAHKFSICSKDIANLLTGKPLRTSIRNSAFKSSSRFHVVGGTLHCCNVMFQDSKIQIWCTRHCCQRNELFFQCLNMRCTVQTHTICCDFCLLRPLLVEVKCFDCFGDVSSKEFSQCTKKIFQFSGSPRQVALNPILLCQTF